MKEREREKGSEEVKPLLSEIRAAHFTYMSIPLEVCRCHSHHIKEKTKVYLGEKLNTPKPDDRVCAKERAWRHYCRLRDQFISQEEIKQNSRFNKRDKVWLHSVGRNLKEISLEN